MLIIDINGGLGNQMFQYAFGRRLAIKRDKELKLDISNFKTYELRIFLLDKYKVSYSVATDNEIIKYRIKQQYIKYLKFIIKKSHIFKSVKIRKMYFEKQDFIFDLNVFTSSNVYYVGYWQSYKYFKDIRDILIKEFTLKDNLDEKNIEVLSQIKKTNAVSLHIRRGDYVSNTQTNKIHGTCSLNYYEEAIKEIDRNIENPVLYVFSDDIEWVKKHFKTNLSTCYIDFNDDHPERDINLMSNCKHNIIANSSFSWWGAWLNNNQYKTVIAPQNWINSNINTSDLIPKDWIRL